LHSQSHVDRIHLGFRLDDYFFLETISATKSYDYGNFLGLYAAYS